MRGWRPTALAVALVLAGAAASEAQTVVVTGAPAGAPAELVLNATTVASGMADPQGTAILIAQRADADLPDSMEAFIWIDVCGDTRRVVIVDRNTAVPPPPGACVRTQIDGVFLIRPISSMAIDLSGSTPSLRLRQGDLPEAWLAGSAVDVPTTRARSVPGGLILSGGGGLSTFRDFGALACGNFDGCDSGDSPGVLTGGASFWFHRFVGVEASYVRTSPLTAEGSSEDFRFTTDMEGGIATLSGTVGFPFGGWRVFGKAGVNYHEMTLSTTQTIDDRIVTVGGVDQNLPGGTQAFQSRLGGWGWQYGGGAEFWLSGLFGVYGEGGRLYLEGDDLDGGEARIDEGVNYVVVGARIRVPIF